MAYNAAVPWIIGVWIKTRVFADGMLFCCGSGGSCCRSCGCRCRCCRRCRSCCGRRFLALVDVVLAGAAEGLGIEVEPVVAGQCSDDPLGPFVVQLAVVVNGTAGLLDG